MRESSASTAGQGSPQHRVGWPSVVARRVVGRRRGRIPAAAEALLVEGEGLAVSAGRRATARAHGPPVAALEDRRALARDDRRGPLVDVARLFTCGRDDLPVASVDQVPRVKGSLRGGRRVDANVRAPYRYAQDRREHRARVRSMRYSPAGPFVAHGRTDYGLDWPAPEAPTTTSVSPRSACNDTWSITTWPSYDLTRSSTTTRGSMRQPETRAAAPSFASLARVACDMPIAARVSTTLS